MNYALKRIYIKSNWFSDTKNNTYKTIGSNGFYIYINLFRFRIFNQEAEYTFITSISLLKKETGYTSQLIFDLLKLLVKEKVIKVTNITRWDRIVDKNGRIADDKILIIEAIDRPNLKKETNDKGEEVDVPETDEDWYISVDLPLFQYYLESGLSERYLGLHCLICSRSNLTERKSWMTINNMADVLGFGDKQVNAMIHELNRQGLLASYYKSTDKVRVINGKKVAGKSFEHVILRNLESRSKWLEGHRDQIEKNIAKWDKKKGE